MTAQIIQLPRNAAASEVIPFYRERGQKLHSLPQSGKQRKVVKLPTFGGVSPDDFPPTAA